MVTLPDKHIYLIYIYSNGVTLYIGEFILERINEYKKWKMLFTADEKFQSKITKKVIDYFASGFSGTFYLTEDIKCIERSCREQIIDFIDNSTVEIVAKP